MELLFIVIGGAMIGAIVRYSLPRRAEHGSAVLPGIGAIVAAVVWVALTWLGWAWDGGWIWVATLGAVIAVTIIADLYIGRHRVQADARLLEQLTSSTPAAAAH